MINKREGIGDALKYLERNFLTLKRYLREHYNPPNRNFINYFFQNNPVQARIILEDFKIRSDDKKLDMVVKEFNSKAGFVLYIVGARGGGKTCTAFKILEKSREIYPFKNFYYIGRFIRPEVLPEWCLWAEKIQDVPQNIIGVIDELGIQASARTFQEIGNKQLTQLIITSRQQKKSLIILCQDAKLGEINVWRLRDANLWKISNTYSLAGRDDKTSQSDSFWGKIRWFMKARAKDECLFEYPEQKVFLHFSHKVPKCWNEELSEIYRDFKIGGIPEEQNKEEEIKDDF